MSSCSLFLLPLFLFFHLSYFGCQIVPLLPINFFLVSFANTWWWITHFLRLLCLFLNFYQFDLSLVKFLPPLLQLALELLSLILVRIRNFIYINLPVLLKVFDRSPEDLFDSWQSKKTKWICHLANVELVERKNEIQLVFFVIANETYETILRFINQILIFQHIFLNQRP